jgi:glutamate/tyrosine decarboxylase-like PLP-dependent enzyme
MALAEHGEAEYAAMLDHQARMGNVLRESLEATGWRIVNSTPLPVICFSRDGISIPEFIAELRERQIAWMSDAQIGGEPVVRACITSFKTTQKDIEWVVGQMNSVVSNVEQRETA